VKALLVLVALTTAAYAQAPDKATRARAAKMYEQGSAHYEAGRFSEAIPMFRDAYELVHDPVYLFNLAQSYRKVLDCEHASEFYKRYLDEAKDADKQQRERVNGWLRELEPCVEQRRADAEAARKGQEAAAETERIRQAEAERRRKEGPQYTTIDNGKWFRIGGYAAAGLGAVGIGLGIRYGIKGSDLQSELAEICDKGCNWNEQALRDKDEAGKRANKLSATFYVAGGVALAGGVVLYIIGRSRVEHVRVEPVEGGATVSTRVSF
jgi:hypothetical protein